MKKEKELAARRDAIMYSLRLMEIRDDRLGTAPDLIMDADMIFNFITTEKFTAPDYPPESTLEPRTTLRASKGAE